MTDAGVLVRMRGVIKDYRSLRPLRIRELDVRRGRSLSLLGFDEATAEVLVNLLTGGITPDEGEIEVFGEPTAAIRDRDRWIAMLDRFGLVSERAVLLEQLTAEQNLAIPWTLAVESMSDAIRADVRTLAEEVGITGDELTASVSRLPPAVRLRIRLGRALALRPDVVLAEHPNAALPQHDGLAFARDFRRIARRRGLATIVMTADPTFARAAADQVLVLQPATGELQRPSAWSRWRFLFC